MVVEHKGQKAFWKPDQEKACEGQWGDGKNDFLEEDDTEDDSEDCYSIPQYQRFIYLVLLVGDLQLL